MAEPKQYKTVDKFDRLIGSLADLPDVARAKPATVVDVIPLTGEAQTFVIQTFRQRDVGDTVFLQHMDSEGRVRIAIPPKAVRAIVRQLDTLTSQSRKRAGKQQAALRKARGEKPAFLKGKE